MKLELSSWNLEEEVSSFKIDWFIGISISNFKGVWQAQFLSHIFVHKTKIAYFLNIFNWCWYHFLPDPLLSDSQKIFWAFLFRLQCSLNTDTLVWYGDRLLKSQTSKLSNIRRDSLKFYLILSEFYITWNSASKADPHVRRGCLNKVT